MIQAKECAMAWLCNRTTQEKHFDLLGTIYQECRVMTWRANTFSHHYRRLNGLNFLLNIRWCTSVVKIWTGKTDGLLRTVTSHRLELICCRLATTQGHVTGSKGIFCGRKWLVGVSTCCPCKVVPFSREKWKDTVAHQWRTWTMGKCMESKTGLQSLTNRSWPVVVRCRVDRSSLMLSQGKLCRLCYKVQCALR